MKRQFEKVLNDFQPGLLESIQCMHDSEDPDAEKEKEKVSLYRL